MEQEGSTFRTVLNAVMKEILGGVALSALLPSAMCKKPTPDSTMISSFQSLQNHQKTDLVFINHLLSSVWLQQDNRLYHTVFASVFLLSLGFPCSRSLCVLLVC